MKNIASKLSYFAIGLIAVILFSRPFLGGDVVGVSNANAATVNKTMPEFTQASPDAWLNSAPVSKEQLKGKVVLIDFWTFDCWNCYRSFPWLHQVEDTYEAQGLQVIGIHSPEFAHEHERPKLEEEVRKFKLEHPIMMDNDFAFWQAFNNRYWPAFYLIDKKGVIRQRFIGETHAGTAQAQRIEQSIEALLAE